LQYNEFQRTVIYAVSLGGDTDTIASMAGAIAGACYGIECVPAEWSDACEGTNTAKQFADKLFQIVSANNPDGNLWLGHCDLSASYIACHSDRAFKLNTASFCVADSLSMKERPLMTLHIKLNFL